jgi:pimeloyl-ACP methyl ester carboxylesterase
MHTPVVLIHGTNAGPWSMANFARYFKDKGWRCHSPAYRYHDRPAAEQRTALAGLSIADYVEDLTAFVEALEMPAILVGHSLGGVVSQQIAARGLARGIVLINCSVNWGILPSTPDERALGKLLISAGSFWEGTLLPDFETMARFGLNKLAPEVQRTVFDRLGPESGRVMFELFFWMFDENATTKIDYDRVNCPVLVVSGSEDLAVSTATAQAIAERHGPNATFREFKGFGHYLTLEPGWRTVAEACAAWMAEVA